MSSPSADDLAHLFDTVVRSVTLRAGDLERQRGFYERAIGLTLAQAEDGQEAVLANAAGEPLVRLDASRSAGSAPLRRPHTGLFHTAFRFPDRASLAAALVRALEARAAFQGASDHGVSEAVYLADAEGNGIELYRDRPYEDWPHAREGEVAMFTHPLDVGSLLEEADERPSVADCDIGHIHLMTADVERASSFWQGVVGLVERQRFGPQATFLADGLYHHHVGANTWHSAGAPPAPPESPGLDGFELALRGGNRLDEVAARLERAGHQVERRGESLAFRDVDSNRVVLRAA